MNRTSVNRSVKAAVLILLSIFAVPGKPADVIPLDPRSLLLAANETLEVEQVEVTKGGANPALLTRPAGRFILVVINRNETDQAAGFVIDPAAVGNLKLGLNPLLQVGGARLMDRKHRAASLFAGAPGEYDLKYADSGLIVCHITIN